MELSRAFRIPETGNLVPDSKIWIGEAHYPERECRAPINCVTLLLPIFIGDRHFVVSVCDYIRRAEDFQSPEPLDALL